MGKVIVALSCILIFLSANPVCAKRIKGCKLYYVVKRGDTFRKIASSMGVAPTKKVAQKIAKVNGVSTLNPGMKLCVDENFLKTGATELECFKASDQKKICMDEDSLDAVTNSESYTKPTKKCSAYYTVKKGDTAG